MTKGGADVVVPHTICVALCSFLCLKTLQQLLSSNLCHLCTCLGRPIYSVGQDHYYGQNNLITSLERIQSKD
jgi:hypothetical protein